MWARKEVIEAYIAEGHLKVKDSIEDSIYTTEYVKDEKDFDVEEKGSDFFENLELRDAGGTEAAEQLYNRFVEKAKSGNPITYKTFKSDAFKKAFKQIGVNWDQWRREIYNGEIVDASDGLTLATLEDGTEVITIGSIARKIRMEKEAELAALLAAQREEKKREASIEEYKGILTSLGLYGGSRTKELLDNIDYIKLISSDGENSIKAIEKYFPGELDKVRIADQWGVSALIKFKDPEKFVELTGGDSEVNHFGLAVNLYNLGAPITDYSKRRYEENFDSVSFDKEINGYFNEAYDETILYTTTDGSTDLNGNILLNGILESVDGRRDIKFLLQPSGELNESANQGRIYNVFNNRSEEIFKLEMD